MPRAIEIWKDIEGWEGKYQVSNLGRVKSFYGRKEKIMNARANKKSMRVGLCDYKNKILKDYRVHRLVAAAFIPNPHNHPIINHIDNDWTNNKASNLEWCTQQHNIQHAVNQKRHTIGEKSHFSKLSLTNVLWIRDNYNKGVISVNAMATKFGVHRETIRKIAKREIWKHI